MENRQIEELLSELSTRLRKIETRLGMPLEESQAPAQAASVGQLPGATRAEKRVEGYVPFRPVAVAVGVNKPSSGTGSLLGVVALICFVLAGVFIVKLAIDSGWLTPERQIGCAVLFGLSLIGGGFLLRERDEDYAGILPAAGIIVLYLAGYGAKLIYGLIDTQTVAIAAGGVTALSLWLFQRFRHDFFAVSAAVGSYALPVLLSEYRTDQSLLAVYLLFWALCFSSISIFIESRVLPMVASYLGLGIGAAFGMASTNPDILQQTALVQLAQFVCFSGGVVAYSIRNRSPLKSDEAWSYFLALLFFYGTEYSLMNRLWPDAAPWISLGCAGLLFMLYRLARSRFSKGELHSHDVVEGFCAVVGFHSGYLVLLPKEAGPFVMLGALAAVGYFARSIGWRRMGLAAVAFVLMIAIEYGRILTGGSPPAFGIAAAATLFWIFAQTRGKAEVGTRSLEGGHVVLLFAHLQAVMALYRFVHGMGSLAVSAAWGGYAALVLAAAFARRDAILGRSSVVILVLAAGKVLLYDVSYAPPVVRILCLCLTGSLLYLSGFLFRRFASWRPALIELK